MSKKNEKIGSMPVRSQIDEFGSDEMLECPKCNRKTPPNRLDCIYCAEPLDIAGIEGSRLRPLIRPPLEDEPGFHLVCLEKPEWNETQAKLVADMTRIDPESLAGLVLSGSAVPLALGGSKQEVRIASERMREAGLSVEILPDGVLSEAALPKRLRRISAEGEAGFEFVLFNNDEVEMIPAEDIFLFVIGILIESKTEDEQKKKRRGKEELKNSFVTNSDEVLIDIYSKGRKQPFRIRTAGFDFSFLGDQKDLLAVKNIEKTIDYLTTNAPAAHLDNNYRVLRPFLDKVWANKETAHTENINKRGFGGANRKRVTTISNQSQFGRYSRLQEYAANKQSGEFN